MPSLIKKISITAILFLAVFTLVVAIKANAGILDNVAGWLWGGSDDGAGNSTGLGWISMNSLNCDADSNGFSDGVPTGCPAAGTVMANYGVNIPTSDGNVTGYAWSENFGWISFQPTIDVLSPGTTLPIVTSGDDYPFQAKRVGNELRGWARILSIQAAGGHGWVRLQSDPDDIIQYGITLNGDGSITRSALTSYAWSDEIGWIDFSHSASGPTTCTPVYDPATYACVKYDTWECNDPANCGTMQITRQAVCTATPTNTSCPPSVPLSTADCISHGASIESCTSVSENCGNSACNVGSGKWIEVAP